MPNTSHFPLGVSAVMLPELDFPQQTALCRSLGLAYYVYRPRIIPRELRSEAYSDWGNHRFDLTPDRLVAEGATLSSQLTAAGLSPLCTLPEVDTSTSNDEWDVHFEGAVAGGCSQVRISPADHPTELFDYAAHLDTALSRYRELVPRALQCGLKPVIEMHVGNAACGPGLVREILRNFPPDDLGVILDLPNLSQQGYVDPVLAISVLAPWIDHCHIGAARRVAGTKDAAGFRKAPHEFCELTEGDLYLPDWLDQLSRLDRTVPLIIEDFTPEVTGADRLRRTVQQLESLLSRFRA